MLGSPVGVAAWIVETFYLWSDQRSRPFEQIFSKDQLLTEVMIYLVTRTFNTASWSYAGFVRQDSFTLPDDQKIEVPTGVAAFAELLAVPPPRVLAERVYNIVQ
jgi:microsomal epoxide hydrolase